MKKVVILGNGQVGKAFTALPFEKEIVTRQQIDFTLGYDVMPLLDKYLAKQNISAIVNCIAYTNVDKAEVEQEECYAVNSQAVRALAEYAALRDILLIHFSTDFVFDGEKTDPYNEEDIAEPLGVYGKSKLEGELLALNANKKMKIFRLAWVYSAEFENNFIAKIIKALIGKKEISVVDDQVGNLCNAEDLAQVVWQIIPSLIQDYSKVGFGGGLYHLTPDAPYYSRFEIANIVLRTINEHFTGELLDRVINPVKSSVFPAVIRRPANSRLNNQKFINEYQVRFPDWVESCKKATIKLYQKLKA